MQKKLEKSTKAKTKKTPKRPPITAKNEKFAKNIADGEAPADAYQSAYPKAARSTARVNAYRLLANTRIQEVIEKRKQEAAKSAKIDNETVIGAAAREAFATIDDVLDGRTGKFSIRKARETGAIHHVKSITRTPNKYGESIRVEMYSAADARRELGDYLGIKQLPRENEQKLKQTIAAIEHYLVEHPEADRGKVINTFAAGRGVPVEPVLEHFGEVLEVSEGNN